MDDRSPDMLRPTLIAGALFGAASAIPFVNFANCACCALIWGCGLFASWLYASSCRVQGVAFRPGTGAIVGLIAGAFYAISQTAVEAVVKLTIGDPAARMLLRWLETMDLPAENRDLMLEALRKAAEPSISIAALILGFFFTVLIAAIFSTLGGLIGGAVFKVAPPPAPPAPGPAGDPGTPPAAL